jgi:WD40 repeat protein
MPRPERSLDPGAGPIQSLAAELRALRRRVGNPGYREMAERAGYSVAALANAAGGRQLPTLAVTLGFIRACDGDAAAWERRWQQAAAELVAVKADGGADADTDAEDPPYRGLAAYGVDDADRFFGRRSVVAKLVGILRRQRFVAVFGVSGSGKSSLLRAGLVPALVDGWPTGDSGSEGDDGGQDIDPAGRPVPVLMTPGARPVMALRRALAEIPAGQAVLLVVDQFEEVFTLCHASAERAAFVAELAALVGASDGGARVVVGVRADFYTRCAGLPELAALIAGANVPLGPLSDEELREIVTGPARLAGLSVERALVTKILADASGQPGALPLVSHALLETWRQRRANMLTVVGYEAAGGVAGAIARSAEAVYARLDVGQRETARQVLTRLVTFGEGVEDTRRRVGRAELDLPGVEEVLDRLAAARLVTVGQDTVEIAHEALIQAWPRLQQWLSTDRDGLRTHRQLTEAAQTWVSLARDAGSLYRGARLVAAREWAASSRSRGELNPTERAFLDASVELEDQERAATARHSRQLRYLTTGLAVLLLVVSGISVVAVQQRHAAVLARQIAISRQLATQALALAGSDPGTAMLLSVQAFRIAPTAEARSALLSMSMYQAYRGELAGHTGAVSEVMFTPDGQTLTSVGRDRTVGIWDVRQHRRRATLAGHNSWLKAMALSPDGRTLATGGDDHDVVLWDMVGGTPVATLSGHTGTVAEITFSPDGRMFATASRDGTVMLWDAVRRGHLATLTGHTGPASGVKFSPDGRTLATAGRDGTVMLWDVALRSHLATLTGHAEAASSVAFSPDGQTLATGGGDTTVILWDLTSRTRLATFTHGKPGVVMALKFSPDGRTLATAGNDPTVLLWDTRHRITRARLTSNDANIYTLDFNPRGTMLASAGEGGTITLWDITRPVVTGTDRVNDIAFSPDGHTLAVASLTQTTLWNPEDRTPRAILAGSEVVNAVTFSPDGHTLATATEPVRQPPTAGSPTLWDHTQRTAPVRLTGHTDRVLDIAFSPDGRTVASGSVDNTVILWDLPGRTPVATLTGHTQPVNGVAFSPDGRILATAGHDPAVLLWDVKRRVHLATLTGHTGWVRTVAFSPDGRTLATASVDQTVILWDLASRTRLATITDHTDAIYTGVAFSPDGHTLAYTSGNNTVVVWDLTRRAPLARLTGHTKPVRAVAFSPDGTALATSSEDQTVILWDTDAQRTATHICEALVRDLPRHQWQQFIPDLPYQKTCTQPS